MGGSQREGLAKGQASTILETNRLPAINRQRQAAEEAAAGNAIKDRCTPVKRLLYILPHTGGLQRQRQNLAGT
jgi:hypothetical protein